MKTIIDFPIKKRQTPYDFQAIHEQIYREDFRRALWMCFGFGAIMPLIPLIIVKISVPEIEFKPLIFTALSIFPVLTGVFWLAIGPKKPAKDWGETLRHFADIYGKQQFSVESGKTLSPNEQDLVELFVDEIYQKVYKLWLRTTHSEDNLLCKVQVRLSSEGKVLESHITLSSGDLEFDRAAEDCLLKASPLPVPMEGDVFERKFSYLNFSFSNGVAE